MGLVFALRMFSDMTLYFYFAGLVGGLMGSETVFFLPIFVLTAASWLSFLLRGKGLFLRCAPYLLAGLSAFWIGGIVDIFLLALPVGYLVFTSAKELYSVDRGDFLDRFQLFVKVMPFLLVVAIWSREVLEKYSLPYGVLYVVSAVYLLRLLRHDEVILRQPRFRALNALSLAALCGAGVLLSSQAFLNGVKTVIAFIYTNIITPVLMLFAYLFMGVAWLAEWLIRFFPQREVESQEQEVILGDQISGADIFGEVEPSQIVGNVLQGIVIILVALALILLLRRMLGRRQQGKPVENVAQFRMAISADKREKPRLRRGDPRDQVRILYGRFLKLCTQYGLALPIFYTSRNVQEAAQSEYWCDRDDSAALRQAYLVARYSEDAVTAEDARQARRHFASLRAKARKEAAKLAGKDEK